MERQIFCSGLCEFHLGQFEKASAAFKATAERVPLTEVLNNIGVAENRRGRHDAADYFQKAVQADPSDADYHFNFAIALYRKGDLAGTQRQLRETLSRRPNDTEAKQFQESLAASLTNAVHPATIAVPLTRIKRNYDESSYRQLAVELQNAIDESVDKAKPSDRADASHRASPRIFGEWSHRGGRESISRSSDPGTGKFRGARRTRARSIAGKQVPAGSA